MPSIDSVLNELRRFTKVRQRDHSSLPSWNLESWTKDLALLMHEYCPRPSFHDQATWSLRHLVKGANTTERQLIEKLDAQFQKYASLLLKTFTQFRLEDQ